MLGLGIGLHKKNFVGGGVSYDATYQAILDYATAQGYTLPSDSQKLLQNQLVIDLKASGVWAKLDTFANFATDGNSNFALIDWKRLTQYTAVNSPIFTANQGFTGGGTRYIDTNYNPSTQAVNYQLNNASVGTYIRTAPASPIGAKSVFGTTEANGILLMPQLNSTTNSIRLNSSSAIGLSTTNQVGTWVITRRTNDRIFVYKNGVENSTGRLSTAIGNNNIFLLRRNDATPQYWDGQISFFFAGASLDSADSKALTGMIENYINGGGGNRLSIFFGDSITFGRESTIEANRWTSVFSSLQGTMEQNYGRSGSMMVVNPIDLGWSMYERQGLIPNYVTGVHKYLFFAYGTNDSRLPTPETAETFESIYNEVLQTAYSRGWTPDRIKIVNIYAPETETTEAALARTASVIAFNNAIQNVCTTNNIQLMDITTVMTLALLADPAHPNDAGHAAIANYINTNIL